MTKPAALRSILRHNLNGDFDGHPMRVPGVMGGAVQLNGSSDYIDFGHSTALRLTGSMTITAWIRLQLLPSDDAAIVSQSTMPVFNSIRPSTKGRARSASNSPTPVQGSWHVTGRLLWSPEPGITWPAFTMPDRRPWMCTRMEDSTTVSCWAPWPAHNSVPVRVSHVGRRPMAGFEFAGSIDDVRIYSAALTQADIAVVMSGKELNSLPFPRKDGGPGGQVTDCAALSDSEDGRIPLAVAALGVLVAIACTGLSPRQPARLLNLAVSLSAGFFFFATRASSLPSFNLWMMPLVSFAGSVSVAISIQSSAPKNVNLR